MTDIMIIDDDEMFGILTRERLEETGWSVDFHFGPFGTLNALRTAAPRVAILDVNMPALSGTKLSEMVHKTRGLEQTKVMLMSSMDQRHLEHLARAHGADAALDKGATREQLIKALRRLLES